MNKCMFLPLVTACWASHPLFPVPHSPHHCPAPGYTECAGLGWALQACSPNCRIQMPIRSRMSCSSGPGLARGRWHLCGTWPWLRFCPWRVYLSAKEREIFGNAITRWTGHILAKYSLPKQPHLGLRAPHSQFIGVCVELVPPADGSSQHRCGFSTL